MAKKPVTPQPPAPPPAARSKTPILIAIPVVVAVLAGAYAMMRSPAAPPPDATAAADLSGAAQQPGPQPVSSADTVSNEVPAAAKFGPHKQDSYPPLPSTNYPPPRPIETVSAVYHFAAEHPEVLGYVPCYCGCDRQGHKGNDDCFVARRGATGDVEAWDSHGMT